MYCSKCGTKLEDGAKFCSRCGSAINWCKKMAYGPADKNERYFSNKRRLVISLFAIVLLVIVVVITGVLTRNSLTEHSKSISKNTNQEVLINSEIEEVSPPEPHSIKENEEDADALNEKYLGIWESEFEDGHYLIISSNGTWYSYSESFDVENSGIAINGFACVYLLDHTGIYGCGVLRLVDSERMILEVEGWEDEIYNKSDNASITGYKTIKICVIHSDLSTKDIIIGTNKETLTDAINQENLVEVEEGEYGHYIETVDDEVADLDFNQYWSISKNGEICPYGPDDIIISDGDFYEFRLDVSENDEEVIEYPGITSVEVIDEGTWGDNLSWSLTNEGTLTVSGFGSMKNYDINDRPWKKYCDNVTSIIIESGVTQICDYAFAKFHNLKKIEIPETVSVIGDVAFASCFSLEYIILPTSLTEIGYGAFGLCKSLICVVIKTRELTVDDCLFINCYDLTEIYYSGTKEQWAVLNIETWDAEIYCEYLEDGVDVESSMKELSEKVAASKLDVPVTPETTVNIDLSSDENYITFRISFDGLRAFIDSEELEFYIYDGNNLYMVEYGPDCSYQSHISIYTDHNTFVGGAKGEALYWLHGDTLGIKCDFSDFGLVYDDICYLGIYLHTNYVYFTFKYSDDVCKLVSNDDIVDYLYL